MTDARAAILARLAGHRTDQATIAAQAAALLDRVGPTRPDRVRGAPDAVFLQRLASPAIGATGERIATLAELPEAVGRYLAAHALPPLVAVQPHPDLAGLAWAGIATHADITPDEAVAVGLAHGGIAETASLVFHSGAHSPTLFAFLPMHHIVALHAHSVRPWLEDHIAADPPRNVNLVTGPSGTTDIEGTLVRGAHGPGHLHVVMIGSNNDADPVAATRPA